MIRWVAERAAQAYGPEHVVIATDSEEIRRAVPEFTSVLTGPAATGTDRVADAASRLGLDGGVVINVQGDEPLIDPQTIRRIYNAKERTPYRVINGMAPLDPGETDDDTVVKVVTNHDGKLLYASRCPIPFIRSQACDHPRRKQIGIYAYHPSELRIYRGEKTAVEACEDIEILRFLEKGVPVGMLLVQPSVSVDLPGDIALIEQLMQSQQ